MFKEGGIYEVRESMIQTQEQAVKKMKEIVNSLIQEKQGLFSQENLQHEEGISPCEKSELMMEEIKGILWETLELFQEETFLTAKGLEYTYTIKGNELFVSRKNKSITRATVELAFLTAIKLQQDGLAVSGPKKLKTFGASYLYPVFIFIGIIS